MAEILELIGFGIIVVSIALWLRLGRRGPKK